MKNSFLSICQKSCYICDKSQYTEASFTDKLRLRVHLLFCKSCRDYSKKNTKLTKLVKQSNMKCMCSKKKQEIQNIISSELTKH